MLEISIHSHKGNPITLQLSYYVMPFAPNPLISLLLKLSSSAMCSHTAVWGIRSAVTTTGMTPSALLNPGDTCVYCSLPSGSAVEDLASTCVGNCSLRIATSATEHNYQI